MNAEMICCPKCSYVIKFYDCVNPEAGFKEKIGCLVYQHFGDAQYCETKSKSGLKAKVQSDTKTELNGGVLSSKGAWTLIRNKCQGKLNLGCRIMWLDDQTVINYRLETTVLVF